MIAFVIRRILISIPVLIGSTILTFLWSSSPVTRCCT